MTHSAFSKLPNSPVAAGLFSVYEARDFGRIVSYGPMPYRRATEHRMTLFNRVFTTRILVKIIFVLTAMVVMKAISLHYDFSWTTALAGD
jgi:hypothetical protein